MNCFTYGLNSFLSAFPSSVVGLMKFLYLDYCYAPLSRDSRILNVLCYVPWESYESYMTNTIITTQRLPSVSLVHGTDILVRQLKEQLKNHQRIP